MVGGGKEERDMGKGREGKGRDHFFYILHYNKLQWRKHKYKNICTVEHTQKKEARMKPSPTFYQAEVTLLYF